MPGGKALAAAGVALIALAAVSSGCTNPFESIEAASVRGYLPADILPADREVGSWRRPGAGGVGRRLLTREFRRSMGDEAAARAKRWWQGDGAGAGYQLGETGRFVTVDIYDLGQAKGAFDVYSLVREKVLAGERPAARVVKAGAQGLLATCSPFHTQRDVIMAPKDPSASPSPEDQQVLIFWAERFLAVVAETGPSSASSEATLLAFAGAVTAKLKQPFELPEAYVLQVPGSTANSERCEPGRPWGRSELTGAVTARWTGKTGSGTLFISVAESSAEAARRFEKLRRATDGNLAPNFAGGLFAGSLPGAGPVVCFRHGKALAGLVGAAEHEERLAVVEEIRRRCAGEATAEGAAK